MKKKLATMLLCGAMILSLAACGGSSKSSVTEKSVSECFDGSTDGIWYYVNYEVEKDIYPRQVIVFEDGEAAVYNKCTLTLGELSKMTDEEIIEQLKADNSQSEYAEEQLEAWEQAWDGESNTVECSLYINEYTVSTVKCILQLDDNMKELLNEWLSDLENYELTAPAVTSCELAVFTDSSGNYTQTEKLKLEYAKSTVPHIVTGEETFSNLFVMPSDDYYNSVDADSALRISTEQLDIFVNYGLNGMTVAVCTANEEVLADMMNLLWCSEDDLKNGYCWEYAIEYFMSKDGEMDEDSVWLEISINSEEYEVLPYTTATKKMTITGTAESDIEIYDSYYNGFSCDENGSLITRTAQGQTFTLDTPDTEGVTVDPKNW